MAGPYDVTANRGILSPNISTIKSYSSPPSNPTNGSQYYDTTLGSIGVYVNGVWAYSGGSITAQALTESSTITWNVVNGTFATVSLSNPTDALSVTGLVAGKPSFGTLVVTHAFATSVLVLPGKTATGFAWAMNTNGITELSFLWDGTILRWVSAVYDTIPVYGTYTTAFAAYLATLGVTLSTLQKQSLSTFEAALTTANLIGPSATKIQALYPIVGGVASAHVVNFLNPANTDASFRGIINGTVTNSATGILPVTNGYMDSRFAPNNEPASSSIHISIYLRTNIQNSGANMGVIQNLGSGFGPFLNARDSTDHFTAQAQLNGVDIISASNTDSRGLFALSGTASGLLQSWKNGVSQGTVAWSGNLGLPSNFIWIGASDGSGAFPQNEFCYASIGQGFATADALAEYNAVQALQTALSRNV